MWAESFPCSSFAVKYNLMPGSAHTALAACQEGDSLLIESSTGPDGVASTAVGGGRETPEAHGAQTPSPSFLKSQAVGWVPYPLSKL